MKVRRPFGLLAARFAPLALLLLLPGLVELHAPGAGHSATAESVAFFPAAEHPNQPRHVEPGQEAAHPECATCLHRLETRSGAPTAHVANEVPASSRISTADRRPPLCAGSFSPSRGRAPPSLSV